jgi:hypothetical protein
MEWNSESFLFRGTAAIPSEQTIHFVYSVFRGIIFFAENSQPYKGDKLGFQDGFKSFLLFKISNSKYKSKKRRVSGTHLFTTNINNKTTK